MVEDRLRGNDRKMKNYYVYILASEKNGTLYIGMTNNLAERTYQHKTDLIEGFTKKYQVHNLVYFEHFGDASSAINREKQLKKWNRQWKINLVEKENPQWNDLFEYL
jgi:putative endonuclease